MTSAEEQLRVLRRGSAAIIPEEELTAKLRLGRPLVVKAGFDPSAPDIHLGHTVVLHKMKQFQQFGHEVVFVVGDFTARIGDPSGRSKTRPALNADEVRRNAETYRDQVVRILDPKRTRFAYNSTWLEPLGAEGWMRLAGKMTVARMLERDDFAKRYRGGIPISIHEFLYPLAQGYDSVALKADVELGGTDQTFNLLVGRDLMREYGLAPQVILTTPLLVGLDGVEKMSKSLGNYIAIDEPAATMYGKVMKLSDELMWLYYECLTDIDSTSLRERVATEALHPMRAKQDLATHLVAEFHGPAAATSAEAEFERVFRSRETPTAMVELVLPATGAFEALTRVLVSAGLAASTSDVRRLLNDGAVTIDGARIHDPKHMLEAHASRCYEIKLGKHRFARLRFE